MFTETVTTYEAKRGVETFNSRYAEMERALWCLSRAAVESLTASQPAQVIDELVWTIKSWWGIQGVRKETKSAAAQALIDLRLDRDLLKPASRLDPNGVKVAVDLVSRFVDGMMRLGVSRREWSLASKTLHWLMPWRVPVYDSFVKKSLCISVNAEHKSAYWSIVRAEFEAAQRLLQESDDWLGDIEPRSPFRALDKYLWWSAGGDADTATVVKDPWRVIRMLGIEAR